MKQLLSTYCTNVPKSVSKNIATKKNGENLCNDPGNPIGIVTVAGSGSITVFRANFFKRLAELFVNLQWLHASHPSHFPMDEFKIYEDLFDRLAKYYHSLPQYLLKYYKDLKHQIQNPE